MSLQPLDPYPQEPTRHSALRTALISALQQMVDASDVVLLEVVCRTLPGGPVAVSATRRPAKAPATSTLAVTGLAVPASETLPQGSMWVSAATEPVLEQARSWPVLLGALVDNEIARQVAEDATQRALEIANRDPATGLGNRRAWEHILRTETVRSHRSQRPLTLMVIDIDGLKAVNDARGHATGDALILRAAQALFRLRRATDEVCRLGGDEFGIAAPETDEVQARFLATRVRKGLQEVGVRVSLGVAVSTPGFEGHALWQQADDVMYTDKRARRPSWEGMRHEADEAAREGVARLPRP